MRYITIFLFTFLIAGNAHAAMQCVAAGCGESKCVSAADAKDLDSGTCNEGDSRRMDCFKSYGTCKEQEKGKCGWSVDKDLNDCLRGKKRARQDDTKAPIVMNYDNSAKSAKQSSSGSTSRKYRNRY